jgi:hypothetical protein
MKTLLVLFGFASLFDIKARAADAPKWIEFPGGLTYALVEKDDLVSTRIPLNPLPGAPALASIHPSQRDIVFAESRPAPLASAFRLKLEPGTAELGPALVVTASASELLPGNYLMLIEFILDGAPPETPRAQSVTFTLQRAAPQLTSLRSVNAWQELRGRCKTRQTAGRLYLREESRKAAVRGLSITEVRNPVADQARETGRLIIAPSTTTVPAGGEVELQVTPKGDFPVGKTTGKIYVRAPNLATPLVVDYEVTSVRTAAWIAIIALLGALFGWLIRVFFQSRRERAHALIAASEMFSALTTAKAAVPDAEFVRAINDAETALQTGAGSGKPATIDAAVAAARTALADAKTQLAARRNTLAANLMPLRAVLHQSWQLPPAAEGPLAAARTLADGILALANTQNIRAAQDTLDEQSPGVCVTLANAAGQWRSEAAKYLDKLAEHPPALPDQGAARLKEAVAAWENQFGEYRNRSAVTIEELKAELINTHAAFDQARSIARDLGAGAEEVSKWVRGLFADAGSSALFDQIVALAEKHAESLANDLSNPDLALASPADRQQKERAAWEAALTSAIPGADHSTVKAALDAGEWTKAAEAAHKLVPVAPAGGGKALARGTVRVGVEAPPSPLARGISLYTNPVTPLASAALRMTTVLTGEVSERVMLSREEKTAAALQSLLLSIVFIALAYGFYGGQWVGTFREMLGVFAWAFGLDLTADALAPLIRKVGTPQGAS